MTQLQGEKEIFLGQPEPRKRFIKSPDTEFAILPQLPLLKNLSGAIKSPAYQKFVCFRVGASAVKNMSFAIAIHATTVGIEGYARTRSRSTAAIASGKFLRNRQDSD
jgi:hypothetical protein